MIDYNQNTKLQIN